MNAKRLFFPEPERELRGERAIRTTIRTAHIAVTGVLVGGHVFGVDPQRLTLWLVAAIGSGVAFVAVELYGSCVWLTQLRGIFTFAKLALLCLVPVFWPQRVWILFAVLVIGSVGSHMPSRFRYYSFRSGAAAHHGKKG